jgi:hypothetical protein
MTDSNTTPTSSEPSAGRLLRSTLIALAVAALLLVTIVLPAEWGIDPTGVGRVLGLQAMGETKMQLAREEAARDVEESAPSVASNPTDAAVTAAAPVPAPKSDVTTVTLQPTEGKEIKLAMVKDARATYSWSVAGGQVNYDTHADSPTIDYHGYAKGTGVQADSGVLVAAFDGMHGWYWRNRGRAPVVVTLRTSGDYTELKRLP